MGIGRVTVRQCGVLMSRRRMLVTGLMVALRVVLGCPMVGLRCVLMDAPLLSYVRRVP
jgi:hypothetical protein